MEKIIVALITGLISAAVALLPAQVFCFALSYYGIHTGLFANWLLVVAAEAVISGGVFTGINGTKD